MLVFGHAGITLGAAVLLTRTILLGKMKCELCHLMDEKDARPDTIASNLSEAAQFILKEGDKHGNLH